MNATKAQKTLSEEPLKMISCVCKREPFAEMIRKKNETAEGFRLYRISCACGFSTPFEWNVRAAAVSWNMIQRAINLIYPRVEEPESNA
jgi:hypothetical protein